MYDEKDVSPVKAIDLSVFGKISSIPSGGYEIEILLNFKSRAALVERILRL